MSQLSSVLAAHELLKQQEAEAEMQKQMLHQQILKQRDEALDGWLQIILSKIGLDVEVKDHKAEVDGYTFMIDRARLSYVYFPLEWPGRHHAVQPRLDKLSVSRDIRCQLAISSDLADEYRQRRPDANAPYAEWIAHLVVEVRASEMDEPGKWLKVAANIGAAVQFLGTQKQNAAEFKRQIDDAWEAKQRQAEANRQAEAARRAEAVAEHEVRMEEQRRLFEEREKRNQELRAEVASKFGISMEAFDYLIEALAVELQRREYRQVEY